ncbi:hypothetical protein AAVH_05456 [Aphelenchoides avenae]|nr:hypothetical protein AAVH_05456 [Aphelenchus avenae]
MRPLDLSPLFFAVLHVFIVPALTGCKNSGVDAFKERESVRRCENRDMGPGVRHVGYYPRDSRKCQATIDDNCYKCRILQDTPPDKYNENGEKVAYTSHCKDNCCNLLLDGQRGCPPGRDRGLVEYVCIYWEKRNEDWSWYCYIVEVSCRNDGTDLDYVENHKRHLTVDQDNKPEVYFVPDENARKSIPDDMLPTRYDYNHNHFDDNNNHPGDEHHDHYANYHHDNAIDYDQHFLNYDDNSHGDHYYYYYYGDDDYPGRDYHDFLNDDDDSSVDDDDHHSSDRVDYHANYAHYYNDNRDEHHHACNDLHQHRFISH